MSKASVLLLDENKGFGGAERHVVTLAHELKQRDLLASVVGRKDSWLYKEAAKSLPFSTCGFRNEVDMFSVFAVYKMVKASGANVLHCIAHRDLVAAALARQLPGAPRTVLVKAEHSFPDDDLSPLFRWAYRQCDGLASVSMAMQRALKEKLHTEAPWDCEFKVIANGIDMGPEPQPRERPHGQRMKIGILSALRPGKGHRDLLEALSGAKSEIKDRLEITIAGDGPLKEELETLSRELQVEVTFLGHKDDPTEYLGGLDLCVLPSHTETFSLVALESLTQGVPLLAADSDGVAELYPEPDMLFCKGSGSELLAKLERFLNNPEAFSQRALELSKKYRQDYSRQKMGDRYQRFYDKLISKGIDNRAP
jgi:glycosyltransferase involved in cell wall biosynthesis